MASLVHATTTLLNGTIKCDWSLDSNEARDWALDTGLGALGGALGA
jgi:hypothetical protein